MVNRTHKKSKGIKRTAGEAAFDYFNILIMIFVFLITVYPFYYVFLSSISGIRVAAGLRLLPNSPTLSAYETLFEYKLLWNAYTNTIIRCVLGVLISLLVTALAAFPLSKRWLPFGGMLTNYFLITMLFGGGLIPTYLLVKDLNMLNTIWALVVPGAVSAYNVFIVRNFFRSIPDALEESAMLDGASWFTIWTFIILPLSKPVLATISLWVLVGHWNAWFDAMIYIQNPYRTVVQVILRKIAIEHDTTDVVAMMRQMGNTSQHVGDTLEAATIMVTIIPMLIVYPFLQKYFVRGIMIGSIKG
ncbi:MAG: carbohydrate ABC transporter permease [Christensenellales bacterium]|jgi:putative aldouronate transport system permease protein